MRKTIKLLLALRRESKGGESNVTSCFALPCSQSSSSTWMHIKELRCVLPIWTAGRSATRLDDFISVQSTHSDLYIDKNYHCSFRCALFSLHRTTSTRSVVAARERFLWLTDSKVPLNKSARARNERRDEIRIAELLGIISISGGN